jgi:hypothetical protein
MYQLLEIEKSPEEDPGIVILKIRIRKVCELHLQGCAGNLNLTNRVDKSTDGSKVFHGAFLLIKIFEFSRTFEDDLSKGLVFKLLQTYSATWVKNLHKTRDRKSLLWYQSTEKAYITWSETKDKDPEFVSIPNYRLGDLVYLWMALKCFEQLVGELECAKIPGVENLRKIIDGMSDDKEKENNRLSLSHASIKELIIQRFICQASNSKKDPSSPSDVKVQLSVGEGVPKNLNLNVSLVEGKDQVSGEKAIQSAEKFAISRSLETERFVFKAKDVMLFDGYEWGFFDSEQERTAWSETIKAQSAYCEFLSENPLRYALYIRMQKYHEKLGDSEPPEQLSLQNVTLLEKLRDFILPSGLFAERLNLDTQLPTFKGGLASPAAIHEIASTILRQSIEETGFKMFDYFLSLRIVLS